MTGKRVNRLPSTPYLAGLTLALMLAACTQPGQPQAQVDTTPPAVEAVNTPAVQTPPQVAAEVPHTLSMQVSSRVMGTTGSSNHSYTTQLYWMGKDVRARIEIPGTAYPDQQGRLLYLNYATKKASVYFAASRQPDPAANKGAVASITAQFAGTNFASVLPANGAGKVSAQQMLTQLKALGFQASTQPGISALGRPAMTRLSRSQTVGDHLQTSTADVNPDTGTLTHITNTDTKPDLVTSTVSDLTYTSVPGLDNPIPTTIETSIRSERLGSSRAPIVQLPVSTQTIPEGQELVLKPGEFIAASAPKYGEGSFDPNVVVLKEKTVLSNIQVDQQTAADFVEGN